MKRTLSLVLALVMVLGSFTGVFAAETKAEKVNAPEFLKKVGVLEGNDNGDLMLDKNLKRRDTVVLLSRLMGVEDVAKNFPAADDVLTFKDITDASYKGYLAWSVSNKLIEGHTPERFGFNEFITAQQYAAILLRALGYEIDDAAYAKCLETSKGLGILANVEVENKTEITRAQMAEMTFNALGVKMKDKDQTLADKLGIKLPTPEVLAVEKVVADNLKEIKIVFNKAVDRDNVEDKDIYSTNVANASIKDAQLVEDNTVILTLEGEMKNKKEYKLNIRGIKDGGAAVNTEFKFTALDNAIPEVVDVVGLGTKAVKVVMSEPVKNVKSSNFKVDGKTYYGSVDVAGREIILKPYGSSFSVGEHTLVVASLEDYAGFKSVEKEFRFEIAEDKEAPTVLEVKGTLERVVVTFSEDVDNATVTKDSLYWGGTKSNKADRVVRLSGSRYAFEFSGTKALPTYETTLTISGVKDYSANEMKATDIPFKAEIDQTRPEVIEVKVDDEKTIIVKFNKALSDDAKESKNYVITDEDGKKVSTKTPELSADRRTVTLSLYSELKENKDYTLKISGIRDNTKLANTILPYEEKISAGNYKNPKVEAITGNSKERTIHILFNKKMDVETIADESNYMIVYKNKDGKNVRYSLKVIEGEADVIQDGKAVVLTLPEKLDKRYIGTGTNDIKIGKDLDIHSVIVSAVKDTDGNVLQNYGEEIGFKSDKVTVEKAVAKDKETIELTFSQPVKKAEKDDFKAVGFEIDRVVVDGSTKVVIETVKKLTAGLEDETLSIREGNKIETVLGIEVKEQSIKLIDEISPTLKEAEGTINVEGTVLTLKLTFDEKLSNEDEIGKLAKRDLEIRRADGKKIDTSSSKVVSSIEHKTNVVVITITDPVGEKDENKYVKKDVAYEIEINSPGAIIDLAGNKANKTDGPIVAHKIETETTKTVLGTKIADAEALVEKKDEYTPASWTAAKLEKVIAEAKEVNKDPNATQKQIDAQVDALNEAIAKLDKVANTKVLDAKIAEAKALVAKKDDYTEESWKAADLEKVIKAAEAVFENKDATQAQVDAQVVALVSAMGELKENPKTEEPKVEEPKVDEPKADEPKADEPKADEPKADPAE